MKDIQKFTTIEPLYISITDLRPLLSVGKVTAEKVGEAANAKVKVGKRTLYNVEKIKKYMESLS